MHSRKGENGSNQGQYVPIPPRSPRRLRLMRLRVMLFPVNFPSVSTKIHSPLAPSDLKSLIWRAQHQRPCDRPSLLPNRPSSICVSIVRHPTTPITPFFFRGRASSPAPFHPPPGNYPVMLSVFTTHSSRLCQYSLLTYTID